MKAKFDSIVSRGTYGALSPEQEQFIALTAQLEQISSKTLHLSEKMAEQAKADKNQATGNEVSKARSKKMQTKGEDKRIRNTLKREL